MQTWIEAFQFWRPKNSQGHALAGCVAAVLLIVIILPLRYLLSLVVFDPPQMILFTLVVLVATLVGGWTAGFFSLILSALVGGGLMWLESRPLLSMLIALFVFAVTASLIIWVAAHYRSVVRELGALEGRRALLHRELLHRSRNLQMVIHSIVRHTLAGDRAKAEEINSRIASLATASHLLNQSEDQTADLGTLLRTELLPYGTDRVELDGPRLQLPSLHVKVVALVFHELGTNAAKYGSLSTAPGRVRISWSVRNDQVTMNWLEMHGPPVRAPTSSGFGTIFVERMLESVQGEMAAEYGADGFACRIDFRLRSGRESDAPNYDVGLSPPQPASGHKVPVH